MINKPHDWPENVPWPTEDQWIAAADKFINRHVHCRDTSKRGAFIMVKTPVYVYVEEALEL